MSTPTASVVASPTQSSGLPERLARLVDSLPDALLCLNRDWFITYANAEAIRISRLTPEAMATRTHWQLYPETIGTVIERQYRLSMQSGQTARMEYTYEPFAVTLDIQIIPTDEGIALLYRDITAQRTAEAREREHAERLRQVFEATSDAIAMLDREWRYTYLNSHAQTLIDPDNRLIGKVIWDEFPKAVGGPAWDIYHRSMNERTTGNAEIYYPEPLNLWLSLQSQPTAEGIVVFFRDITKHKNHDAVVGTQNELLEHQRAEIESVYETAPIGLALFDPVEFRYLRLNERQAQIVGLPKDQILGRTLTEIAPIPGLREMFEQVAAGHPIRNQVLEGELPSTPGEHRYWTVNYFPVYAPDGSVQAITTASLEITNLKKSESALIQSEKLAAVGRLASSISHEINNPLEAVTNLLYLIAMNDSLPDDLKIYVHTAQSELSRVSQIATQTLRFHRQAVAPTSVTAADLVNAVIHLYTGRLANSSILVETRYATDTTILCFENDIRQVLNNLIANAIDAMRTGGRLIVRAHAVSHPAGIRITIADTGHGMPPAVLARAFEPFFTTKDLNGNGLGLWISKGIVDRHQGRLSIRSSARGTVFTLFLPSKEITAT